MTGQQDASTIIAIAVTLDNDPEALPGSRDLIRTVDGTASFGRFAQLVEAEIRTRWAECATADISVVGTPGSPTTVRVEGDEAGLDSYGQAIKDMIQDRWQGSRGGDGNSWVVGIDGSTFECPAGIDEVILYENTAGHLFDVCGDKTLSGVELTQPSAQCFDRDARALLAGEVFHPADGMVWHTIAINLPWSNAVARLHRDGMDIGGRMTVFGRYGRAGREALGRKNLWVITNHGQILVQRCLQPDGTGRAADFDLADDKQTWNGGNGVARYWDAIASDDPRITPEIRKALGPVYEDED